jgi:hypothetical protein
VTRGAAFGAGFGSEAQSSSTVWIVSKPEAGGVKRPRRSIRTSKQVRDEVLDRVAGHLGELAEDPHGSAQAEAAEDMAIIEGLSDPLTHHTDQARRTHNGQVARRKRRRRAQ